MWQRVTVITCNVVETSEVPARSPAAIWLGHHVQRRCPRGAGRPNDLHFKHLVKLLFGHPELVTEQRSGSGEDRRALCGDNMENAVCRRMFWLKTRRRDVRELGKEFMEAW